MLEITSKTQDDLLIATLSGRIDATASKVLEEQAMGWIDAGQHQLILDCAPLIYISSAGLRVFLLIAKRIAAVGGSVKLCGVTGAVHEVFEISGFSRLFTILPSVGDAL